MTAPTLTVLCPAALARGPRAQADQRWPAAWRHARVTRTWSDSRLVVRELGHERWLRERFGMGESDSVDAAAAATDAVALPALRLTPVHLHAGRDHLLLTDPAQLALTADEADALAGAVRPLLDGSGLQLSIAAGAARWYLHGDSLPQADAFSLALANGHSIDAFSSIDPRSRPWRRLLNEIQMTWVDHPVNLDRASRGQPTVNSLWLDGRATTPPRPAQPILAVCAADPAIRGLAKLAGVDVSAPEATALPAWLAQVLAQGRLPPSGQPAGELGTAGAQRPSALWVADFWRDAALSEADFSVTEGARWTKTWTDFGRWLDSVGVRDRPPEGFAEMEFVLTDDRRTATLAIDRRDHWKFWQRPDLAALLDPASAAFPAAPASPASPAASIA